MKDRERISRIFKDQVIADEVRNITVHKFTDGRITSSDNPNGDMLQIKIRMDRPEVGIDNELDEKELAVYRADALLNSLGLNPKYQKETDNWVKLPRPEIENGSLHRDYRLANGNDFLSFDSDSEGAKTSVVFREWDGVVKDEECTDITITMPVSKTNAYLLNGIDMDELEALRVEASEAIDSLGELTLEMLLPVKEAKSLRDLRFRYAVLSQPNLGNGEIFINMSFDSKRIKGAVVALTPYIVTAFFHEYENRYAYVGARYTRVGTTLLREVWEDAIRGSINVEVMINEHLDSDNFPSLNIDTLCKLRGTDIRIK